MGRPFQMARTALAYITKKIAATRSMKKSILRSGLKPFMRSPGVRCARSGRQSDRHVS